MYDNSDDKKLERFFNKTVEDENKKKYRSKLIQLLGDKLPIEDKLYATVKELEEMVEKKFGKKDKEKETSENKNQKSILYKGAKLLKNQDNAIGDFARNYTDMVDANTNGADKYFHAKANLEAAQRGLGGEIASRAISGTREVTEGVHNVLFKGKNPIDQINDAIEDDKANRKGRKLGRENKNIQSKYLLKDMRPKGLDEKY